MLLIANPCSISNVIRKGGSESHEILNRYDALLAQETDEETRKNYRERPTKRLLGCFSVRQPILWTKSCMNSVGR